MNVAKFYQALRRCYEESDLYLKLLNHKGEEVACISDIRPKIFENKTETIKDFVVESDHDFYDEDGKKIKAYMLYHEYSGFRIIFSDFREDWL